jgi:hypothetical protein
MSRKRLFLRQTIRIIAPALIVLVISNLRSLREGLRYLRQMLSWRPEVSKSIAPDGSFGICYDLVRASNATRCQIILDTLRHLGLEPLTIPVPDESLPNVLVRFHSQGPYTLFIAHYDKSRETPTYQGASDNTAAVSVLLAVACDLLAQTPTRAVALLFTSAEERGLKGANAFHAWAQEHDLTIGEVVNLDMLGRARLAIRPSALPGFYFWLPLLGELVYDGRGFRCGKSYALPDPHLVHRLTALMSADIAIYQRFTAYSDSNVFQDAGLPTVTISSDNMYYLDLVWERDEDRVELLDERNLALARQLIVGFAGA